MSWTEEEVASHRAWLAEELEFGSEWTQGTTYLHEGDRHCCLGVASELKRRATGEGHWKVEFDEDHDDDDKGRDPILYAFVSEDHPHGATGMPTSDVVEFFGFDRKPLVPDELDPDGHYAGDENALYSHMNDNGYSFFDIAEMIRKNS